MIPGLGPLTGQVLCSHPLVRKVDLTGGTSTGRVVGAAAGNNLAGVITELGGKAPMLIFNDADVEQVCCCDHNTLCRFLDTYIDVCWGCYDCWIVHRVGCEWCCFCDVCCQWTDVHHGSKGVGS